MSLKKENLCILVGLILLTVSAMIDLFMLLGVEAIKLSWSLNNLKGAKEQWRDMT